MPKSYPKYFLDEKLFWGIVIIKFIERKEKHVSAYFDK